MMARLRMTTARYYTPSGRSIQAKGITPDIFAEQQLPEELQGRKDVARPICAARWTDKILTARQMIRRPKDADEPKRKNPIAYIPGEPEDDKQLQDAIQLLIGLQKSAAAKGQPHS